MKKKVLGLFALLIAVPVLNVNVSAQEVQINGASEYNELSTNVSAELVENANKYVTIVNNRYVYQENTELSAAEVAEIKGLIRLTNESLSSIERDDALLVKENEGIISVSEKNPVLSTFGYGVRSIAFQWWGIQLWLTASDVRTVCQVGVGALASIIGVLITHVGWKIVNIISGGVGSLICHFAINDGIWLHFNYALGITAIGWQ